jgi:hypothetical protein
VYEFNTTKKEKAELAGQFMKRLKLILDQEKVTHNNLALADIITKHAPDWRRIINECQKNSVATGSILASVSSGSDSDVFSNLIAALKAKDFKKMRSWVVNNQDIDTSAIIRGLYDRMNDTVQPQSIPQLVLILADYQYKDAFVADHELNMVACMTEIMAGVSFQ